MGPISKDLRKSLLVDDHAQPKAYRPIAMLNTLGKAMEAIMADQLVSLADTYHLPSRHIGGEEFWHRQTTRCTFSSNGYTKRGQRARWPPSCCST